jgi:hypothetical protein
MLLISDGNDWTKNNETVEYPFAQHVYQLYNRKSNVELAHFPLEGHDYGKNKRAAAYAFLAKHLGLKLKNIQDAQGHVSEDFVGILPQQTLTFFTEDERKPLISGEAVYQVFLDSRKR